MDKEKPAEDPQKRRKKIIVASALAVVLVALGAVSGTAMYYQNRVLPGTTVAGENVSGKTRAEFAKWLESKESATNVTVKIEQVEESRKLSDYGVTIDAKDTQKQVFAPNANFFHRVAGLFNSRSVEPKLNVSKASLEENYVALNEALGSPAVNASVAFKDDEGKFAITKSVLGTGVAKNTLESNLTKVAKTLKSATVTLDSEELLPKIDDERAGEVAAKANAFIESVVAITDEGETISPDVNRRATWVKIETTDDDENPIADPTINEAEVKTWLDEVIANANQPMEPALKNVNSRGEVKAVVEEGQRGFTVNNGEEVFKNLLAALGEHKAFEGTFSYDITEPEVNTRLIADGAENLIYMAAPGEKWIDLNLSSASVTAYEGATPVIGPIPIVPGAPGMETVSGMFKVWLKVPSQTMSGTNLDGSRYSTPGVPWVLYFHGDYAFHGAPWRGSFGWSGPGGSHGCVNMPVPSAQELYEWAPIGTVVASHY